MNSAIIDVDVGQTLRLVDNWYLSCLAFLNETECFGPTIKMIASSVELVILISGETGAMIQLNFCRVGPHTEDKVIVMKIDFR